MYCPRCSQRQVSDEVRYCSQCGFQLEVVSELIQNDGKLMRPDPAEAALHRDGPSLLVLLSVLTFFVSLAVSFAFDSPYPFIPAGFLFAITLSRVMRRVFENAHTGYVSRRARQKILRAAQKHLVLEPATSFSSGPLYRFDTGEMAKPPSVTERTTRHLDLDR